MRVARPDLVVVGAFLAQLPVGRYTAAQAELRRRVAQRTTARDLFWLGRAQSGSGQEAAAVTLAQALDLRTGVDADSSQVVEVRRLAAAAGAPRADG